MEYIKKFLTSKVFLAFVSLLLSFFMGMARVMP